MPSTSRVKEIDRKPNPHPYEEANLRRARHTVEQISAADYGKRRDEHNHRRFEWAVAVRITLAQDDDAERCRDKGNQSAGIG